MIRTFFLAAGALLATLAAAEAGAVNASDLLGAPLTSLRGEPIGAVDDLIVDTSAGRVVYLIVDRGERFATYPVRALAGGLRIDQRLEGEVARLDSAEDTRFRRAARLIGQPLVHPHPGDTQRIGTIRDFEFDRSSGEIGRVVVATAEGESGFPPGVLAHGRFPPLTHWRTDYVDPEDNLGWLRREPSDERLRLHDHQW